MVAQWNLTPLCLYWMVQNSRVPLSASSNTPTPSLVGCKHSIIYWGHKLGWKDGKNLRCVAPRFNDFVAPLLKRKHIKEDRVSPSSNSKQSKDYASPHPLLALGGLASFQQMPQSGFGIFCYQGVLCVPQGSETLRSGYGTPRIPVKDAGGITHAAIICSYLKLEMFRGYLRDSG